MLDRATSRFADPLSNAGPGTAPVPHLSWTVGETGAHVLAAQRMYCRMLDGEPGIPDLLRLDRAQPLVKGQLLVSGRRPWLGSRFAGLIRNP
jgi:hypothetical protein